MHVQRIGVGLLTLSALTAPAYAGPVLEAYTGVIAGTNTLCAGGGATPTAITSFFGNDTTGFGVLTDPGGNGISDCGFTGGINDFLQAPPGPLNSATNFNNVGYAGAPGSTFTGSASATANYGSVSVSASGTLNGPTGGTGLAEAAAFGLAEDTLDVAGAGSSGYMAFDFTLNGSLTVGTPGNGGSGQMQVEAQVGDNAAQEIFYANVAGTSVAVEGVEPVDGQLLNGQPVPGCVTGSGTFTCTNATLQTTMLAVTFGMPMTFDFGLLTAITPDFSQNVTADPPGMTLTGIQVYNSSQQLVSDFTITSGSGAVYGADGIESTPSADAPEPATFLLASLVLAALGAARRGKRRA